MKLFKDKFLFSCLFFIVCQWFFPLFSVESSRVFVIGDSHASFGFRNIPGCIVNWLGPRTMHRVGRDGLSGLNIQSLGVQNGDTVVFVFGEIDVRCHIGKIRDSTKQSEQALISDLAQRYLNTIIENRKQYTKLKCIIFAVVPPTDKGYNPQYPYYGTLQERVRITQALNRKLHELAACNNIYMLDVYKEYSAPDGSLRREFSDGSVHVDPNKIFIIQYKLKKLLSL